MNGAALEERLHELAEEVGKLQSYRRLDGEKTQEVITMAHGALLIAQEATSSNKRLYKRIEALEKTVGLMTRTSKETSELLLKLVKNWPSTRSTGQVGK